MRADARRNRDLIVEAAREVFREQGYDASLDAVAKKAGVGAGTLYRHFPTRDSLLDAIMQSWVDRVTEATDKTLAFEGPPRELLVQWLETYAGLISMHKGGPAKLTAAMTDPDSPIRTKCQVLSSASQRVVDRLVADGALPEDTDAVRICQLVGGVATVADNAGQPVSSVRPLLEVVADGLLR
jgi:AcrR family transcriptional regulator